MEAGAAEANALTVSPTATQSTNSSARDRLFMIVSGLFPLPRSAGNLTLFLPEVLFAYVSARKGGARRAPPNSSLCSVAG